MKVSKASSDVKAKAKLSFDIEESDDTDTLSKSGVKQFTNPKANVIKKNYTSKDLTGLQVAHDLDSFQAGQSDILVLADRSVLLEDDGETLVSMSLKEDARLTRLREVARHAKGYSGFKAYEEETEDSIVNMGLVGNKNPKILQKYDFASSEFNDEPKLDQGFKIGSVQAAKPESASLTFNNEFDTVQSAGIDTFIKKKRNDSEMEKEKKRARRLAKTLFADEPEMMVETFPQSSNNEKAIDEEEDDSDMQRIIAATRREHLKTRIEAEVESEKHEMEPKFVGGKSFDTLIMSESIFAPNEPEREQQQQQSREMEAEMEVNAEIDHEDRTDLNSLEPFSAEPLVRDGVASTLALLNMRGINLEARGGRKDKSSKSAAPSDIKLEYFDQFGNKLTSKEAYKELSRKFHGKGAGKGKLEKMKRRREETLKMESVVSTSQSAIVTNLRKQQEETGAPYMILSNTRQQSDAPEITKHLGVEAKKPKIFGLQLKKQ